jgi:hypothetical protein
MAGEKEKKGDVFFLELHGYILFQTTLIKGAEEVGSVS